MVFDQKIVLGYFFSNCYLLICLNLLFFFLWVWGGGGRGALGGFLLCNLYLCAYFAVPPRVSDEFRNLTIALNSTFTKKCYLRGDPEVSVNWTKDGVLLSKNNTLIIRQATLKDRGNYECTAKNDYGEANSSFWIDVTGKLYIVVYVI